MDFSLCSGSVSLDDSWSCKKGGVKNYYNKACLKLWPCLNTQSLWHSAVVGGLGLSQSIPGHVLHVGRPSLSPACN